MFTRDFEYEKKRHSMYGFLWLVFSFICVRWIRWCLILRFDFMTDIVMSILIAFSIVLFGAMSLVGVLGALTHIELLINVIKDQRDHYFRQEKLRRDNT